MTRTKPGAASRARHPINERARLAKRRHPNNCMNPMSGGTKEMVVAPYRARYTIYVTPASLLLLLPTFILSQLIIPLLPSTIATSLFR